MGQVAKFKYFLFIFFFAFEFSRLIQSPIATALANPSESSSKTRIIAHTDMIKGDTLESSAELLDEEYFNEDSAESDQNASDSGASIGLLENAADLNLPNFIGQAQKSLEIEIYEINDNAVIKAIKAALDRNVRVRIVVERTPVGMKNCWLNKEKISANTHCQELNDLQTAIHEANKKFLQLSENAQAPNHTFKNFLPNSIHTFAKESLCGVNKESHANGDRCYQHGKIVIVDQKLALISTGNFNSTNLCDLTEPTEPANCNRDYSYITRDRAVVKAMIEIFQKDSDGIRPDIPQILTATTTHQKLTVSPYSYQPIEKFINSAEKSILIQTQYLKSKKFINFLLAKADHMNGNKNEKSFSIQILLSDPCYFGKIKEKEHRKLRKLFANLEKHNIQVRFMTKKQRIKNKPAYLHAKAIVVDDKIAWIGSTNISDSSFFRNREYGIFFRYPKRVRNLSQIILSDFRNDGSVVWKSGLNCQK